MTARVVRSYHASYGGGVGRRMDTLVFYNNPKGWAEEAAATALRGWEARRDRSGEVDRAMYPAAWRDNPQRSPLRAGWLSRLAELRFLDPLPPPAAKL